VEQITPPKVSRRTRNEINEVVGDLLNQYKYDGELPVPVELIVEVLGGLDLVPLPNLANDTGTQGYLSNDLREIGYDESLLGRQQDYHYLLAHEFGHFILHGDYIRSHVPGDVQRWKHFLQHSAPGVIEVFETDAHIFAQTILAPSEPLKSASDELVAEFLNRKPPIDVRTMGEVGRQGIARQLTKRFMVSEANLVARLRYEELP
jgi:hypothetical protein